MEWMVWVVVAAAREIEKGEFMAAARERKAEGGMAEMVATVSKANKIDTMRRELQRGSRRLKRRRGRRKNLIANEVFEIIFCKSFPIFEHLQF